MCIAIGKPIGVKMPSKEILKRCWDSNDDGAGFAFAYNDVVYIKKGYMTFDSFWNELSKVNERYNLDNLGVLLHFRIATHGGVIPSMTHPFPIVGDNGILSKLEYQSEYAVVHNGIISLTGADARKETAMSDTAVFIRDYLTLIAQNRQWFRRKSNIELIEKLIDSKMAILNLRGEIIHTSGFVEDNGVLYSNESYKTLRIRTCSYNNSANRYSVYDDSDYDDYYSNIISRNWKSYNNNTSTDNKKNKESYGLMFVNVGDTICGDVELEIFDRAMADYAVDEYGGLYYIYRNEKFPNATYYFNYEYVGEGWFVSKNGQEREFVPNVYVGKDHFVGENVPVDVSEEVESSKENENKNIPLLN